MPLIHANLPEPVEPAVLTYAAFFVISRTLMVRLRFWKLKEPIDHIFKHYKTCLAGFRSYTFLELELIRISLYQVLRAISSLKFWSLPSHQSLVEFRILTAGPIPGLALLTASTTNLQTRSKICIFRSTIVRSFDHECCAGFNNVTGGNWWLFVTLFPTHWKVPPISSPSSSNSRNASVWTEAGTCRC